MFIIELTYKKPISDVESYLEEHRKFLQDQYDNGTFIMAGRKVPRDGGVIIANGNDKAAIEKVIVEDVFYQQAIADYKVIQFEVASHQLENFKP